MELYNKLLFNNIEQAQALINSWEKDKISSFINIKDFEKFPCVFSYYIDENDYSMNYSATAYYSIVYLDDFKE